MKELFEKDGKKVIIYHYADPLKSMCKLYFNWNGEKDENGRNLLQYIGTEKVRAVDEDFWVKLADETINTVLNDYDIVIISDARFVNEIKIWREKEQLLTAIRVERLNHKSHLTEKQKNHISEKQLDDCYFDYIVTSENLDELNDNIHILYDDLIKNN